MPTLRANVNDAEPRAAAEVKAEMVVGRKPDFKNKGILVWNALSETQVQQLAIHMRNIGIRAEEIY